MEFEEMRRDLNRRGRRMTHQRRAILEVLQADRTHPTAEEICVKVLKRIPRISLGTVYRNLQVLVEEGWAIRLPNRGGSHRFDGDAGRHHHAFCRMCGRVLDISDDLVPSPARRVTRAGGFEVEDYRIEFLGVCARCSGKR